LPCFRPKGKNSTPRHGRLLHPSSRDEPIIFFPKGGNPKTGHPTSAPATSITTRNNFRTNFRGWRRDEFSIFVRPPQGGPPPHAALTRGPTICLGRGDDACVLGAAERAGNALYGARVYVELGRRLSHVHAARQSHPDSLSQLIRDRRPAKALTFTLGPP